MQRFDRDHFAILILAGSCWLPIARAEQPADKAGKREGATVEAGIEVFTAEQKAHWAYQPLKRPEPPAVRKSNWVRNPIDRFILAELESVELPHAPEADRIALIKRLTFDLTGLPPGPEEVAAFLTDQRPDAYERLVDRLLQSPRYGERWAQHWLDLAHYADSNGFEIDAERPDAWRYRDWVVRALNDDLPYDRFIALQIAGDEIKAGDHEALIATGFGRCGPRELVAGNIIPEVKRQNELTEITGTVGSVFLGLTIGCARRHDHKFDAIPTTDYYRLQSFFAASELVDLPIAGKAEINAFEAAKKAVEQKVAPLRAQLAALEAPYRKRLAEQKHALLTADERAVMAIPQAKRSAEQKRLVQGLQTSLRVTWEEVAAAVAAARVDHDKARDAQADDRRDRTHAAPPARSRHGAGGAGQEGCGHFCFPARRLPQPRSKGRSTPARSRSGKPEARRVRDGLDPPGNGDNGSQGGPGQVAV